MKSSNMNLLCPTIFLAILPLISGGFNHDISLEHENEQLVFKMTPRHSQEPALTMHLDFHDSHRDADRRAKVKSSMADLYQAKRDEQHPFMEVDDLSVKFLTGTVKSQHGLTTTLDDNCMSISVKAETYRTSLSSCFPMDEDVNWFYGIELEEQHWPMEKHTSEKRPLTTIIYAGQSLAEPYFVNSKGLFLYFDPGMSIFYSVNSQRQNPTHRKQFCIYSERKAPYYRDIDSENYLNYTACKYDNPKIAHMKAVEYFLGKPTAIPDTKMIQWPIWTTWAKYKIDIDANKLIEYAQTIIDHGFTKSSQMEIDDSWEVCYGAGEVDKTRFPNMKETIAQLNRMGFRTTMWIHPFVNNDCQPYYMRFQDSNLLLQNLNRSYETNWWNSRDIGAAHFDFTRPEVAQWYLNRLNSLRDEIGVDSFKFDAGESTFAPENPKLNCHHLEQPGCLTREYVKTASQTGPMIEYKTGAQTQYLPNYIRMVDRNSDWTFNAGLPTLVTSLLALNIAGYPFVMPDMIGGNEYAGQVVTEELFVRWTQANVFMPILQFSLEPWKYGQRAVDLTKQYVDLHYKYSDKIIAAMHRAVRTGQPVNPPIWWVAPTDPLALACDDEFLLGDDILVAPVLTQGATNRSVYLPHGHWRDEANPALPIIVGPKLIPHYHAPLDVLPYFTKVKRSH